MMSASEGGGKKQIKADKGEWGLVNLERPYLLLIRIYFARREQLLFLTKLNAKITMK